MHLLFISVMHIFKKMLRERERERVFTGKDSRARPSSVSQAQKPLLFSVSQLQQSLRVVRCRKKIIA